MARLSAHVRSGPRITSGVRTLAALVSLLLPLVVLGAQRDHQLRWIVPPEPDVAGYRVYLSLTSMSYSDGMDIGYHAPDPNGVASYLLTGLEDSLAYYVVMTAYDEAGNESVYSNEIVIPALVCDPITCDDGNVCTTDTCSGATCTNAPVADGTSCDDGNPSTIDDACSAGICQGVVPECTADAQCDDGNACNGLETCQSFACVAGTAPTCAPSSQCLASSCNPASGCQLLPVPDGTSCDDGNPSTVGDACSAGNCQGVVPECTADAQCDDGNVCNGTETCQNFACVAGTAPTCAPSTQCLDSSCDPASGCQLVPVEDGSSCDDGNPGTIDDACSAGICEGILCTTDFQCDDGNMCTVETCDTESGCGSVVVEDGTACYDADPETIGDWCEAGVCVAMCHSQVDCPPGAERDYLLSWLVPPDPDLTGYRLYLGFEPTALSEGLGIGYLPPDPNGMASYLLAGLDSSRTYYVEITAYDEIGAEWAFTDLITIPALPCDPSGCNDGDPCTADACSGFSCTNDVVPDGTPCDDGDAATIDDACFSGTCGGVVPECTADPHCDDGDACNGDETCQDFECVAGTAPTCAPPTQCTNSYCDSALGCQIVPVGDGTGCNDGNPSTVNDACQQGVCRGVVPECTADSHCDDGDACNGAETCQAFACVDGIAPTCLASTQCTNSFCDSASGCGVVPVPDGTSCDDGDHFTGDDTCSGGVCQGVVLECVEVVCEDGDFWCELQKALLQMVGEIDPSQPRPCN